MAQNLDTHGPPHGRSSGLLGSFLLLIVILFLMGAVLGRGDESATAVAIANTPTAESNVLATVANTPTIAPTATVTNSPTPTQTPSPTATATATQTPTPSITPNPLWTATATLPPTATSPPPPLPTPQDGISTTVRVPILMYHYISVPPENADVYRVDLSVTPDKFRAQMQYLAGNGHTPIDFYALSRAITNHEPLPPKPVILTFDDGYLDSYEIAYPILQEFGFVATFFIPTEFIDNNRVGYLNWTMIEEMAAAGHRFEPHARTHSDLRARDDDYLIWEILGPQETLAAHIGYVPRYFSYPSGRYDENVLAMLHHLDFWGAVTTIPGAELDFENRFTWPRLRIRNNTPLGEFIDLVNLRFEE